LLGHGTGWVLVSAFSCVGPARVRRLPARMKLKKTLKKKTLKKKVVLCMYHSSKHAEMHSNTLLL
jgi:hypothetical protein